MRRMFFLLSLVAGVSATGQQAFEPDYYFQNGMLWYRPLTDSTAEVAAIQDNCTPPTNTQVVPPTVTDGTHTYTVTRLGENAFGGAAAGVTALVLPETIEEIGWGCFNGSGVQALELPSSLRRIDRFAFFNSSITSLALPASVESIGEGAFDDSDISTFEVESASLHYRVIDGILYTADTAVLLAAPKNRQRPIVLPPQVRRIAGRALRNISQQAEVTLNEGLEEIGETPFLNIQWNLKIPSTVRRIEGCPVHGRPNAAMFAFSVDSANVHYRYEDGMLYSFDGDTLLMVVPSAVATTLTVPTGVKVLADNLFAQWNPAPQAVELPEGLEAIEDGVFDQVSCAVNIPSTVRRIGEAAFRMNGSVGDLVLPSGIRKVEAEAFYGSSVTSVTLPDSLEVVGESAFMLCARLARVESWGSSLREIHPDAFSLCRRLLSVPPFPATLQSVGMRAFLYIATIDSLVFEGAPRELGDRIAVVEKIRLGGMQPPLVHGTPFLQLDTVMVPCGTAGTYLAALGWGGGYNYVEYDCDGIADAERADGLAMDLRGRELHVATPDGRTVCILDALGRTLHSGSTPATVQLPAAGLYLVQPLGGKTRKVVATR